jgi:predicted aspartyl protease
MAGLLPPRETAEAISCSIGEILLPPEQVVNQCNFARRSSNTLAQYLDKVRLVSQDITAGKFYKRAGKYWGYCDFLPVGLGDQKKGEQTLVRLPKGETPDALSLCDTIDVQAGHGKEVVSMGVTYVEGVATGPTGKRATVRFLVDSGATYTLLPHDVAKALDLAAKRTVAFTLADGTKIERAISECHLALTEGEGHTPVILGEPGDEALLGGVTLEILGLILHPFKRTLEPMRMLLA